MVNHNNLITSRQTPNFKVIQINNLITGIHNKIIIRANNINNKEWIIKTDSTMVIVLNNQWVVNRDSTRISSQSNDIIQCSSKIRCLRVIIRDLWVFRDITFLKIMSHSNINSPFKNNKSRNMHNKFSFLSITTIPDS